MNMTTDMNMTANDMNMTSNDMNMTTDANMANTATANNAM
jgi:hypothetical protein